MTEKQQKLIALLEEMFQLNQSDLDFGIYRIMNAKADEIREFLHKNLIGSISEAFKSASNDGIQKELENKINSFKQEGFTDEQINNNPKIQELRAKLSNTSDSTALENDVYSHLTTFFSRYYKDGDFISLRRYKKDTYAIPYEGEEVKLYWANYDQYYIKTSEYFRDYTFKIETASKEKKVHFKLVEADTEANNNKASADKERRFVLHEAKPVEVKEGELYIYFEYKAMGKKEKQDKLNEQAIEKIFQAQGIDDWLPLLKIKAQTKKNKERTLLEKHLKSYTSRNTFDYFIHKDLGGFLNRELDFYIKNEMLYLDDIEEASTAKIEASLNKIKTFKKIARKIIAFLTQLEEFQKSLWLKKKFVIDTNYCITLDKIDESYYEEILANQAQLNEWKSLFDVEVATIEELKNEPYLVLDTKFFDAKFKNKLLSEFDNLDEEIDGLLINSENFGALNLLQNRYQAQVKCTYIDPPYNTGGDGFQYHDNYQFSSWMTFMHNRIEVSKFLMKTDGTNTISIDDNSFTLLQSLIELSYSKNSIIGTLIWKKTDSPNEKDSAIATYHEYLISFNTYGKDAAKLYQKLKPEILEAYSKTDTNGRKYRLRQLRKNGKAARREDRPNMFYPLTAPDGSTVLPMAPEGWEGRWVKQRSSYDELNTLNEIEWIQRDYGWVPYYFEWAPETPYAPYPSLFDDLDQNRQAKAEYKNVLGDIDFGTPKPTNLINRIINIGASKNDIILDYFAGSGTTGHSTIKLNRNDNGRRKYILIEMGEYFKTVAKPRIQKVIYTDNWKDGKPQDKKGISQIFKYFKLESYEDTLNNLAFNRTEKQTTVLHGNQAVKEDYLLNYMLDYETNESQLNINNFVHPFDYKLNIATGSVGETKETAVDLVETFNYLIGLKVKSRQFIKEFLVIEGENLKGEKILIIWREGDDNEALNSFFSKMDFSVYDREFDTIYVNGDNNLANLKKDEDHFKVKLIEEEFKLRMFS